MTLNHSLRRLSKLVLPFITFSLLSFSQVSHASEIDRLVMSLCDSAKSDDRSTMRKKLRSAKIMLRNIYAGVQCDSGDSLLRVATKSNSLQAATFIATKIGKTNLTAPEPDGKNIIQWTETLVSSGDSGKQAFVDLYNSKL